MGVTTILADEKKPSNAGRPCEFCANKEELLEKTRKYIESGKGERPKVLFLNELALILDHHRETIMEWANKKTQNDILEHPEFSDMVKSIEEMQELRLQQRILGRYNPTGAIFLLKTKHGYIETEKKILGGDTKDPLEIIITEAKKNEE